jgi:hypothetical protein
MPSLEAGECCSVIGVTGVGKSNLATFIQRRDVQQKYWGENSTLVALIDANSLVFGEHPREYVVLELMMHRLIRAAENSTVPKDFISSADDLYGRLISQPNVHLALRYIERLCALLCEEYTFQLVFVFDQFEDIWRSLYDRFFLNLRNLRDQFKYHLVYLILTRDRLQKSRSDFQTVEPFWELFGSHTYGLGMYGKDDALKMLERIGQRAGISLTENMKQVILEMSGKHPSMLRAIFWAASDSLDYNLGSETWLAFPPVATECAKIWNDLTPDEQRVVGLVAIHEPVEQEDRDVLFDLELKGLITGHPSFEAPDVFSPVFGAYVQTQSEKGVVVDVPLRQVWLDGRPIDSYLSPLEFTLLAYLARNSQRVCTREEILRELYQEKGEASIKKDQRLDTILRRLREALKEDGHAPKYLVTWRGAGLQLIQGRTRE